MLRYKIQNVKLNSKQCIKSRQSERRSTCRFILFELVATLYGATGPALASPSWKTRKKDKLKITSLALRPFLSLSVCLSLSVTVSVSLCLSACLSVSISLSLSLSLSLSICLLLYPSLYQSLPEQVSWIWIQSSIADCRTMCERYSCDAYQVIV